MVDASPQDWDELRKNHPRLVKKWEDFREQYPDMQVDDMVEVEDVVNNPNHTIQVAWNVLKALKQVCLKTRS